MSGGTAEIPDGPLLAVRKWFTDQPNLASQIGSVLRRALDEVIDGGRTGRWSVDSLEKTEKTYIGTKVEILLRYELQLTKGSILDTIIAGTEVDFKCTVGGKYGWMIPKEAVGQICFLIGIDDGRCRYYAGLLRCKQEHLTHRGNGDKKLSIRAAARQEIIWLIKEGQLPPNFLATLSNEVRARIFSHRSGQLRVNELFRQVQRRLIDRTAIETVAKQLDPMKRMREARKVLATEGILILGHQGSHPAAAHRHGVPVPKKGEAISVRSDGGR